ncbi:hypothetical protein STEG23_000624, partial [Scotinomys teguina]
DKNITCSFGDIETQRDTLASVQDCSRLLYLFCPNGTGNQDELSIDESPELKSLTVIVFVLICDFMAKSVCFMKLDAQ